MSRVYGIIPAAGRSRRMGRPKPALPLHGRPMLHCLADSLLAAGLDTVVIVVNAQGRPLCEPLADRCEIVVNPCPDAEMIESIQLGIRHIRERHAPSDRDGYLICPVDVGDLSAETARACADAFRKGPSRIVIATHAGKHGHPIVFPHALADEVLAIPPIEGLNQLPRRRQADVLEVVCDDPAIQRNINTPADYQTLRRSSDSAD